MNSKQYKEIVSSCKKYENDPLPSGFSSYELLTTLFCMWASLSALTVKNLPAMWETQVQFPSWEDPLKKGMATHSRICLENSMDREAWWATAHGVTKSWTQLSNTHTHTHTHTSLYRFYLPATKATQQKGPFQEWKHEEFYRYTPQ